jgi:hypothetical protein
MDPIVYAVIVAVVVPVVIFFSGIRLSVPRTRDSSRDSASTGASRIRVSTGSSPSLTE